jgi:hypothetical protein
MANASDLNLQPAKRKAQKDAGNGEVVKYPGIFAKSHEGRKSGARDRT